MLESLIYPGEKMGPKRHLSYYVKGPPKIYIIFFGPTCPTLHASCPSFFAPFLPGVWGLSLALPDLPYLSYFFIDYIK
jgi:hypothetical protein